MRPILANDKICTFLLLYKDRMINADTNFFSLNQVEQADVIMAEYREGWAARAEKVISLYVFC